MVKKTVLLNLTGCRLVEGKPNDATRVLIHVRAACLIAILTLLIKGSLCVAIDKDPMDVLLAQILNQFLIEIQVLV